MTSGGAPTPGSGAEGQELERGYEAWVLEQGDRRLEALRSDPHVEVLDRVGIQLAELRRIQGHDPALQQEPTRWAYFPWRRLLASVLGPNGFRTLRLDRNRNKITVAEQDALLEAKVGVVGLSVGHAIAHTLALEGLCGELRLADFDELELSNLNRIPATVLDLGVNKAVVAARRIAELDPYLQVRVFSQGIEEDNLEEFFDGLDLVVEECDSLDMKLAVREAAKSRRLPLLMETSDRGLLDVERYDLEPDRQVFHGVLGDVRSVDLAGLSTHDKVPYVMAIIEPDQLSARMAASMAEIDYTLSTWPQLGGDVALGGATVAAAALRILRGEPLSSGRTRVDLDTVLQDLEDPAPAGSAPAKSAVFLPQPPADPIAAIGYLAGLAPSGGNVQPWRFEVDEHRLAIKLVEDRTSLMDVQFRGTYVAAGAALHNARVAAAFHNLLGKAEICARAGHPEVATLTLEAGTDADLAAQYDLACTRCANRAPGSGRPLAASAVEALERATGQEGARLRTLSAADDKREIARLLGESDRIRYLSPGLHRQMMGELRWPATDDLDLGLDVRTLGLDAADLAKLSVARRADVMHYLAEWDGGEALGEITRDRVGEASALLVITVEGDAPSDFVRGGAALQRCWLAAEAQGIGLQPVSPVVLFALDQEDIGGLAPERYRSPLTELRRDLRQAIGVTAQEALVMVLRATDAPRPEVRSRRLPLDQVLFRVRHGVPTSPGEGQ